MAVIPKNYNLGLDTANTDYPYGKSLPIVKSFHGTVPLPADWVNDYFGFQQALFANNSIVPDGNVDTATSSQMLTALEAEIAKVTSGSTTVIIESASDFPTPAANVITLADDTVYLLTGAIDVGDDRFILGSNTVIRGISSLIASITTTNSGNIFTGAQKNFHFDNWKLTATSGTVFDLTGGAYESAWLKDWTVNSCSSMGEVDDYYSFFWGSGAVVSCTTGLNFVSTASHSAICILDLVEFITGYTWALDFETDSPTFNTLTIHRCGFGYASATNHMKILASNGNLNSGKIGRITQCAFDTGVASASRVKNLTTGDIQWFSDANKGLGDSTKNAQMYMHTASQITTISTVSTPVKLDCSTNFVDAHSDQYTISTDGRITFNGISPAEFKIDLNVSGTAESGANKYFNLYIYVYDSSAASGEVKTASRVQREFNAGTVGNVSSFYITELDTNDWIEVWVENITDNINFDCDAVNLVISRNG